jgi:hypothetical protein
MTGDIITKTLKLIIVLLVFAAVIFAGCVESREITTDTNSLSSNPHQCTEVKSYGNGVLYFDCNEGYFAQKLSDYIGENNVTVTAIASVPAWSTSNYYKGYIVVVK